MERDKSLEKQVKSRILKLERLKEYIVSQTNEYVDSVTRLSNGKIEKINSMIFSYLGMMNQNLELKTKLKIKKKDTEKGLEEFKKFLNSVQVEEVGIEAKIKVNLEEKTKEIERLQLKGYSVYFIDRQDNYKIQEIIWTNDKKYVFICKDYLDCIDKKMFI